MGQGTAAAKALGGKRNHLNGHLPPREHRGHNPHKRWVEREVILQGERDRTVENHNTSSGRAEWGGKGPGAAGLTLKEKFRRMKSIPSFSLRIWRSLCKALSSSTLQRKSPWGKSPRQATLCTAHRNSGQLHLADPKPIPTGTRTRRDSGSQPSPLLPRQEQDHARGEEREGPPSRSMARQ